MRDAGADEEPRFVVHLTLRATDLVAAHLLTRALLRSLGPPPDVILGETTISVEGAPDVQHQVFCDRRMTYGRRCLLRPDHDGGCSRHPLRPLPH
ncbi:hypothetical protein [Micromonospora craniellae]|uniref:Uncharacterized protein n=1 Tax=Micromonospora craniellae TaxID=2294034 RepID=A0A372FWZ8_9ACTN|nr:hypothetical protein [Micromonospora craniellae]QOC90088.1 hypothetical protein ID554_17960 [Micromonospora craniellae]RFS45327.1 hypothetical protein D0Q02_17870 [Micromonospora craniellae]